MKHSLLIAAAAAAIVIFSASACRSQTSEAPPDAPPHAETQTVPSPANPDTPNNSAPLPQDKADSAAPLQDTPPASVSSEIAKAQKLSAEGKFEQAMKTLIEAEYQYGASDSIDTAYNKTIEDNPRLHLSPRKLIIGTDVSSIKKLGGGSSLVYKLKKDNATVAAFKPFQKRFQSNYRAEIAAYRLCPLIKCNFDIPVNEPVYFDFNAFSGFYARSKANPASEFSEIIPTRLDDGSFRVDGTFKEWVPDFADYPIELKNFWIKWLNSGTTREELQTPVLNSLSTICKKLPDSDRCLRKLTPHLQSITHYELARQISNLLVFDFLIGNWDRFSGAPKLYGVNCQIAHGRFISIDNGAAFSKAHQLKPEKHLHEISRFSRTSYRAILALDKNKENVENMLFPNPSDVESERLVTFWKQRQRYLDYVQECIDKNGEDETFFFE